MRTRAVFSLLISLLIAFALPGVVQAVEINTSSLSTNGWYSDDTRADGSGVQAAGTNLKSLTLTAMPEAGSGNPAHDADILAQILFGAAPAGLPGGTHPGSINLFIDAVGGGAGKSQVSHRKDDLSGHASGTALDDLGFFVDYYWMGNGPSTFSASFKIGFKTSEFGSAPVSSRTGENVWDKLLIFEPNNLGGHPSNGTWWHEQVSRTSGTWWLFDRVRGYGGQPQYTLAAMEASTDNYNGNGAYPTYGQMYDLMTGGIITTVQFGIGSGNAGANVYVNQVETSFYRPGDVTTFGPGYRVHNITQVTDYVTIQSAVNAANSGDIIEVDPGIFPEGIVTIGVNLTIQASNTGLPPTITPTANTPGIGSQDPSAGWFVVNSGITANFHYLNFDASGKNIGHVIHHQGPGTITHCSFSNVYWALNYGLGVVSRGSYAFEIANCTFSNIERIGAHFNHYTASPKLYHDNMFVGKGVGLSINYACEVEREANVLAENNVVSLCTGVAGDGSTSAAFLATTYFGGANPTTLEAHGNILSNNTAGFAIGYDGGDVAEVTATENNLEGCDYGMTSVSSVLAEATLNWWGDVDGPDPILLLSASGRPRPMDVDEPLPARNLDEGVDGNVHFSPWIASSGTDNSGAPGWQPNQSVLGVSTNGTIQEGIDLVSGSTVNIYPGTYIGQLTASGFATLNLIGMGALPSDVVIKGTAGMTAFNGDRKAVLAILSSTNVTVTNLTIDGDNLGNSNYRMYGVAYWNSGGSMTNCRVLRIQDNPFSGTQHGVGVYANNNNIGTPTVNLTDVLIDDFQKNGTAFVGVGLTVNCTRVNVVGAGSTSITAQNGIQYSFGNGGSISDCDVSGIDYTGAGFTAAGILLFNAAAVDIDSGTTLVNCETSVYALDSDFDFADGAVNSNSSDGLALLAYNSSAALSVNVRMPQLMLEEIEQRRGSNLDANQTVSITNSTITGTNMAGSVGVYGYSDGDNLTITVDNNEITAWDNGIYLEADGGTVGPATVTDNYLANTSNAYDNTSGHTWDANCYSDYGVNAGYPGTYEITGATPVNVDNNPNVNNCGDIDFLASAWIGCFGGSCPKDTLYLTFNQEDMVTGKIFVKLPAEFDADWAIDGGYPGANHNVGPATNIATNLLPALCNARRSALNELEVNVAWNISLGGSQDLTGTQYIACIPIKNVSGTHGNTYSITGDSSRFRDVNAVWFTNAFMLGSVDITVDCQVPVASFANNSTCAFASAAQMIGDFPISVTRGAGQSPLYSVTVTYGPNTFTLVPPPVVGDYVNATFPDAGQAAAIWAWMTTDGCYTINLNYSDTECNSGTIPITIVKDTSPAVYTTQTHINTAYVYNNTTGPTLLDDNIEVCWTLWTNSLCEANTGTLYISSTAVGPWTSLSALSAGTQCYLTSDGEAASVWAWILGIWPTSNNVQRTFYFKVEDCAGNAVVSNAYTIWIDNVGPTANTVSFFDARPANQAVWLKWAWTASPAEAVKMEVWRSDDASSEYPTYGSAFHDILANYPTVYPPAGFVKVVDQAMGGGVTSAAYTGAPNDHNFALDYWLDDGRVFGGVLPGWPNGTEERDVYRYVTFVQDIGGNWSSSAVDPHWTSPPGNADRSTNYWLGDFAPVSAAGLPGSRGYVDTDDLGFLSTHYFTAPAGSPFCDIGPETEENGVGKGIPDPDNEVDFDDLVPFSFLYGIAAPVGLPGEFRVNPVPNSRPFPNLDNVPTIIAELSSDVVRVGEEFDVTISVRGNDQSLKAVETELTFDPNVVELVSALEGVVECVNGVPWIKTQLKSGHNDKIGVVAAALGEEALIAGNDEIAVLKFRWLDNNATGTTLAISFIKMADISGAVYETTGSSLPIGATGAIPASFALYQNYPNPFNPTTSIRFDLPEDASVQLVIYNVMGQAVRTLISGTMPAGAHHVSWDGLSDDQRAVGTGLYICRFNANDFSAIQKMMLTR